ncbi:DUF2634 domain-containing protein [Desulforamulus ruminis]|uniref:DUF2634 domain-containing protein n=1 Tax=Desulforamulus ruminis TaxID=1564 RepID=UPI00235459FB|nr:DUF2634 domain-containing protein [Desulforamulus ruminis]
MIPQGGTLQPGSQIIEMATQPSRTYRLSFTGGRMRGMTDDLEAIKQAVFKLLQTEKNQYMIYGNYGIQINDLLGKSRTFVQSELKRRITEALRQDDRIMAIEDLQVTYTEDQVLAALTVVTQYGRFGVQQGVG